LLVEGPVLADDVRQGEPHDILLSIVEPGTSLQMEVDKEIED